MLFGGSMQRTKKNHGFTLIELMVTIVVVAIIATMAAPSFGDMLLKQNLNKSTRDLVGILTDAKTKAVLERREITLTLKDVKQNSKLENTESTFYWQPSGKAILKTGSTTSVIFRSNGLVKASTDTTFTICNQVGGNSSKIIVISKMGAIQMVSESSCT